MALGRAACIAARTRTSRAAGVVGGLGCLVDLVLAQRLDDPVGVLADPDALDRAAEDHLPLLAVPRTGTAARPGRWRGGSAQPARTAATSSRVTSRR